MLQLGHFSRGALVPAAPLCSERRTACKIGLVAPWRRRRLTAETILERQRRPCDPGVALLLRWRGRAEAYSPNLVASGVPQPPGQTRRALNHGFCGFRIESRVVQTLPIHPATRATRTMTPTAMRPIRSVYSVSGAPRSSRQRRVSSFFRLTPSKGISSCCPSRSPLKFRQPARATPADAPKPPSTLSAEGTRPRHQWHLQTNQGQGPPRKLRTHATASSPGEIPPVTRTQ